MKKGSKCIYVINNLCRRTIITYLTKQVVVNKFKNVFTKYIKLLHPLNCSYCVYCMEKRKGVYVCLTFLFARLQTTTK